MAALIRFLVRTYHLVNNDLADPRTRDFFLMSNPWPCVAILGLYLHFVFDFGPKFMANRRPFKLDRVLQIYNVIQIIFNLYLFYKALSLAWFDKYSFYCEPVDYSNTPHAIEIARVVWIYFIVKLLDLIDTMFFILRKKDNQISFLHVYHHTGMVIGAWMGVKYLAGGHSTFIGLVNSFVHVIMYSHYLATSMRITEPWWKKYITQLQLIQFIMILYHFSQLLWTDCGFPKWPIAVLIPQNLFMIILFGEFYYRAYIKKKSSKKLEKNGIAKEIPNGH